MRLILKDYHLVDLDLRVEIFLEKKEQQKRGL